MRRLIVAAILAVTLPAHATLLGYIGGNGAAGLLKDLGLASDYGATDVGANAAVTLTIKTDGTWTITGGAGDIVTGSPTTGTWLRAGGVAADYQVKFTPSNQVNSPIITNGAATFTAISANRAITVEKTAATASATVLVELQLIADPGDSQSNSTNLDAEGS